MVKKIVVMIFVLGAFLLLGTAIYVISLGPVVLDCAPHMGTSVGVYSANSMSPVIALRKRMSGTICISGL